MNNEELQALIEDLKTKVKENDAEIKRLKAEIMKDAEEIETLVGMEIKKGEAFKRMAALGLMPEIVAEFERSGIIYYSEQEPFGGILYWLDNEPEWESAVREFEEEYNALVYHVIHTYTEFGELLNLLFVSDDDEEWEYDNDDILEGCVMSYVINLDVPEFSEFGTIGVEEAAGGLIRIA